jgi:glycosyltransferase involved in cell wall biosynthesis/nucleotide-binding universal stress UspA family protein
VNNISQVFKTVLIPIGIDSNGQALLNLAKAIAKETVLIGVAPIPAGQPLSPGAKVARKIRKRLLSLSRPNVRYKSTVIVSDTPWEDMQSIITQEKPDLFMIEWRGGQVSFGISMEDVLSCSLCDVAIVRGAEPIKFDRALIAVRGGPYAELAFQVGMRMHPNQLDVLHLALPNAVNDAAFKGLRQIIKQIPEANLRSIVTEDVAKTILEESNKYDIVVLGATAGKDTRKSSIGSVAEILLRKSQSTIMIVKTRRSISESMFDESVGAHAISILVDKWFAENTFHADEFSDIGRLIRLKEKQGSMISLAMPALNEEQTVRKVITTIKTALMEEAPLLDEIVLMDSDSIDKTREIAEEMGIPVYIHQQLLPELNPRVGKGEALWKSLLVTKGDIIVWIDTDIVNIHPRFVYGIIGPLLLNPNIQFVKGFYRRPLRVGNKIQAGGGGRVTELTARPLLNLFYPELSGVIQPLSGEYAGRRQALEQATFFSGYGVEIGLLIDIFERFGLRVIAQVDLLERIHHNQELEALSMMSFAIIQAVLRKLESRYERAIIEDVNTTMKLIRYANGGYFLSLEEVAEKIRPPIANLSVYQEWMKK